MRDAGDFDGAMRIAQAGIAAAGKDSASEAYWRFRILKGNLLYAQGSSDEALKLLRVPVGPVPHAAELEAQRLTELGIMAFHRADYDEASQDFGRALALLAPIPESAVSPKLDLGRGLVLQQRGKVEEAEALFRKVLANAERRGDKYNAGSALGNLGYMRMKAARYEEALAFFHQLLKLSLPSPVHKAVTLTNMGWCHYGLGDLERARSMFEEADKLIAPKLSRFRSATLGGFGQIYFAREMFPEALAWFKKAADVARDYHVTDLHAEWLTYLAATCIEMNELACAETSNREAGRIYAGLPHELSRGWQMLNAARIAEMHGSLDEAEKGYRSVAGGPPAFGSPGIPDWAGRSSETPQFFEGTRVAAGNRLALLLDRLNRPDDARAEFARVAALVEDKRSGVLKDEKLKDEDKITYLASATRLYAGYIEFLSSHNHVDEALQVAESNRARLLAEKLGRESSVKSAPDARVYQARARDTRTVFLSYWTAPKASYLWVVTGTGTRQFRLPSESELKGLVNSYNKAIRARDLLPDPAASQLYNALIQPAERFIPPGSTVAIVPDGPLHSLNFEALVVPNPRPHYWIQDVAISVVPSLNLLEIGTASLPAASLLLIGDPVSVEEFPRLPKAADEIRSVESNFPAAQTLALTGPAARPAAYGQNHPESFSTIHFTSHAVANYESPLDSAVILSPSGNDPFKLYAHDVMNHPIKAQLVTLSACESAGTRSYSGEGLVGFAWAFLEAGARNVVASLWKADDAATAQIMDRMYAEMRKGKSPAEALRESKLSLIASTGNYRKPNYWAPFALYTLSIPEALPVRSLALIR